LKQWQGVDALIHAAPYILDKQPNTTFLIIGDGTVKDELIELCTNNAVSDKFIFTGRVPYEQVPLYINASDLCIIPKRPMKSGFSPLKLCEYMACEKPVIATRTSGFELIEEYNTGLMVNPENPQEFASAAIELLHNPELRKKMGQNGRGYVLENRSWASVAKKIVEVCEQTIESHSNKWNIEKE
jgi:glycosyltransferase involved in cell wall biosynthesis